MATWKTKDKHIDMKDMSLEHLQAAYNFSEQRYMYWTNRAQVFGDKLTELEKEAERRGVELKSVDEMKQMGTFLSNRRKANKIDKKSS